ncbi:pyridoxal-dependent decarboxylase [Grosmannia clavigera kw1407]|uniref:Pyridoxal-dependent decarboxylase n=1 Tax=Grosmannia clavigera (strain kw1407 / UAMH 11150) TaxID=655863 RepID=F0XGL5_GROCL|nr:pyridoxal-dependent decarboxylase [Grosmannia clavigera kw1407]EFX03194.1 pyridoxal-dependent decarboxylase [Grosmannia clavigera kw1407]
MSITVEAAAWAVCGIERHPMTMTDQADHADHADHRVERRLLTEAYERLRSAVDGLGEATLPRADRIEDALAALPRAGQADYLQPRGARAALEHIVDTVVPALNGQNRSGRYFGFVTGSTLPVAEAADNVVSALDQNVAVHLADETVATAVEDAALRMLLDVLELGPASEGESATSTTPWTGRTFTTGATASNVLALALGREAVVNARLKTPDSVATLGLLAACRKADLSDVRILTSMAHSSLYKAASIVGLGRAAVVDMPASAAEPWRLDVAAVERALVAARAAGDHVVHIIAVSAGEVNTGRFATAGKGDMQRLRMLVDTYGAWLHVDGAFGLFARALPHTDEFARLREHADGLELADSITADGHKVLNVPYDAGIFFSRHGSLQAEVFQNANAAYLTAAPAAPTSTAATAIASPLNMGIESSRRFRALPIYAVLLSEGRDGLAAMMVRMVRLARAIHRFLADSLVYECLPDHELAEERQTNTHIGVLFRAKDEAVNRDLAARINATRQMYVSPTSWQGRPACRVAVSSWRVDVDRDLAVAQEVLSRVVS